MAEQATLERLQERRAARMREGQQTAEYINIPSDEEIRVAIVPLLEREYDECLHNVAALEVPDNLPGAQILDRQERREIVRRSMRETEDLNKLVFNTVDEMMGVLDPTDINYVYDEYIEMATQISPQVEALSEDEVDFLKELFATMPWNDLSGKQVYALIRFLSTLTATQLMDKSLGRLSTDS